MPFASQRVFYPTPAIRNGTAVASQSTTVSSAAVAATGFTATPAVDGVDLVILDIQANSVRVRFDGTDPSGTVGHILAAGTNYTWAAQLYNVAKFIRISTASADATIFATPLQM